MGSPFASVLILTLVLIIQSLLFADGGITTLGANILNMGVIGPFIGFYSFKIMEKKIGIRAAAFLGAWLGTFVPAIAVAVELALANTFPLMQGMLFIGAYHALIGLLIEGIITSVVVCSVKFPIFRVMG
jgi:cobalt/nickel transport system permease protein